jgi:hypothetical protein
MTVVGHLIWAAVVVYAVREAKDAVLRWAPVPVGETEGPVLVKDIPEDLLALAGNETEVWAQEEVVRVIQERYDTLKNWNAVRSSMGIGIRVEAA